MSTAVQPGVAKTQRAKRALQNKAPKLFENVKSTLLLKGPSSSQVMNNVLKDLHTLKKPAAKMFTKRNMTRPFEDTSSVEFLCKTNDASLFCYVSHTKKRPHNMVLGRMFDFQLLDMMELSVDSSTFQPMSAFEKTRKAVVRIDSKPMFVFQGTEFQTNPDFAKLKNLLLDFFRGTVLDKVNIAGLDRVIVCTANKGVVYFRHYGIVLRARANSKYPQVELDLVGPSMDLKIRRVRYAPADVQKLSLQTPRGRKTAKRKNKGTDEMGNAVAKVHPGRQNFDEINIAKLKGLKKPKKSEGADASTSGASPTEGTTPASAVTVGSS